MKQTNPKDYCQQLIDIIKNECNVKQVIFRVDDVESEDWQYATLWFTGDILNDMEVVRGIVKDGLKQRAEAKIKLRQPLQSIRLLKELSNV